MKKILLFSMLSLFYCTCFIACRKKLYTCSVKYYYLRPLGIAFIGYPTSDLDTLIRLRYSGGSNFSNLLSTDTIVNPDSTLYLLGDTVFMKQDSSHYGYFWLLEDQIDYKVILPSLNREYSITGTSKGIEYSPFTADEPCRNDRFEVLPLENTHIDGLLVYPASVEYDETTRYIFLKP